MSTSKLYTISYLNEFRGRTVYTLEEMQQIKDSQRWNGEPCYISFDAKVYDYIVVNDTTSKTTRIIQNCSIILNKKSLYASYDENDEKFVHDDTEGYKYNLYASVWSDGNVIRKYHKFNQIKPMRLLDLTDYVCQNVDYDSEDVENIKLLSTFCDGFITISDRSHNIQLFNPSAFISSESTIVSCTCTKDSHDVIVDMMYEVLQEFCTTVIN